MRPIQWTDDMIETLSNNFAALSVRELADMLGVSKNTVTRQAEKLGLSRNRVPVWRLKLEQINTLYESCPVTEIAKLTSLSEKSVRLALRHLGIFTDRSNAVSRARKMLFNKERTRVLFGLNQKTRLRVVFYREQSLLRCHLKKAGYVVDANDPKTLYYPTGITRIKLSEESGKRLGFVFKPLGSTNEINLPSVE